MPVVINSGSGNQGMTVSLPVIIYAQEWEVLIQKLQRAEPVQGSPICMAEVMNRYFLQLLIHLEMSEELCVTGQSLPVPQNSFFC